MSQINNKYLTYHIKSPGEVKTARFVGRTIASELPNSTPQYQVVLVYGYVRNVNKCIENAHAKSLLDDITFAIGNVRGLLVRLAAGWPRDCAGLCGTVLCSCYGSVLGYISSLYLSVFGRSLLPGSARGSLCLIIPNGFGKFQSTGSLFNSLGIILLLFLTG